MATYVSYSMRVEGRLRGTLTQNTAAIQLFKDLFRVEPDPGSGNGWPHDFLEEGFRIVHWMATETPGGPKEDETVLSFFAMQSAVLPGKVYENRKLMMAHYERLLSYRELPWYLDLREKLEGLNGRIRRELDRETIERIWFREQREESTDGGDW